MDVGEFESTNVTPSVWDKPNEQNRMINVSGVLRTTLTQVVPSQLRTGTGASRIAASAVPSTSAPTAEKVVSWTVVQNASRIWPTVYPGRTSTCVLSAARGQQAAGVGGAGAARPAGPRFLSHAAFQAPSDSIFLSASVTLVHNSVSSFFRPIP